MRGREKQRTKQRGQGWAPSVPQVVDVVARASERNADVVLVQHGADLPVVRGPANGGADAPEVLGGDLALGDGVELDRRLDPLLQDLPGTREIWVGHSKRVEKGTGKNTYHLEHVRRHGRVRQLDDQAVVHDERPRDALLAQALAQHLLDLPLVRTHGKKN